MGKRNRTPKIKKKVSQVKLIQTNISFEIKRSNTVYMSVYKTPASNFIIYFNCQDTIKQDNFLTLTFQMEIIIISVPCSIFLNNYLRNFETGN